MTQTRRLRRNSSAALIVIGTMLGLTLSPEPSHAIDFNKEQVKTRPKTPRLARIAFRWMIVQALKNYDVKTHTVRKEGATKLHDAVGRIKPWKGWFESLGLMMSESLKAVDRSNNARTEYGKFGHPLSAAVLRASGDEAPIRRQLQILRLHEYFYHLCRLGNRAPPYARNREWTNADTALTLAFAAIHGAYTQLGGVVPQHRYADKNTRVR